ncbi:hypothetical protein FNV43_RR14277 [Rhamnella rubrinervis]|uniref:Uncharacterized protein n=1 Tax=Rhamnella rubrinervis TaxID=2594499 RepID=A0A8K0H2X8_9ROSA|nr:hypothetical protein FNV43_RR14277 [Rhamnella rubrinervis]
MRVSKSKAVCKKTLNQINSALPTSTSNVFMNLDFTRLKRVKRERLEEYRRASRKAFFLDEDEEFTRHAEWASIWEKIGKLVSAAMRIRDENWDLRRQIEALKAQKRSRSEALKARKRRGE